jgi:hypothetical protein
MVAVVQTANGMALGVQFELPGKMRALALLHRRGGELAAEAERLEAALRDFFREPAVLSAEAFTAIFWRAVDLWCAVTGDEPGRRLDVAEFDRVRRAALALHRPRRPGEAAH